MKRYSRDIPEIYQRYRRDIEVGIKDWKREIYALLSKRDKMSEL